VSQGGRTPEPGNIVSTYVDDDLKAELVALARRNDRSVSAEIRIALKRHLEVSKQEVVA
jgi:predicted transcriptional regulator